MSLRIPSYRLHKARNLAVVTLGGKDHYLGVYNSAESWENYHRLVAEWLAAKDLPPPVAPVTKEPLTILELLHAYWRFAKRYYVKNQKPLPVQY